MSAKTNEVLDPRSARELLQLGPRRILSDLVNVPDRKEEKKAALAEAEKFIERYGPLRPLPPYDSARAKTFLAQSMATGRQVIIGDRHERDLKWDSCLAVMHYAEKFRKAWNAKTEADIDHINWVLDDIFTTSFTDFEGQAGGINFPVLRADFLTGSCRTEPHTLLDHLAVTLMKSRKMLHRCERQECQRYFVKEFSRDRYCSLVCGEEMRKRGQSRWVEANREQRNRKRRKPHQK